jgi:hypothetical protein
LVRGGARAVACRYFVVVHSGEDYVNLWEWVRVRFRTASDSL